MPVEIRELVIRAVVDPAGSAPAQPQPSPADDRARIVEACVRQVMRVLKKREER